VRHGLRLPAGPLERRDRQPRRSAGHNGFAVPPDEVQAQVKPGGPPRPRDRDRAGPRYSLPHRS
jgi:hypothetical protein